VRGVSGEGEGEGVNINRRFGCESVVWSPCATVFWPRGFSYHEAVRWTALRFPAWAWVTSYQCEVMA